MYIAGAYIKLYFSEYAESHKSFITGCAAAALVINAVSYLVFSKIERLSVLSDYLISYNSVTMAAYSVLLFSLIVNMKSKKLRDHRLLVLMSQATFGIYLIHSNPLMTEYYWNNKICNVIVGHEHSVLRFIITLIAVYTGSMIVSMLRNSIDKKLGISKWIIARYPTADKTNR